MSLRLRSIRQRILLLVLVPVLSLIGLYAFATSITASNAINLARTNTLKNATGTPTGAFLSAINIERPLAMVYLSSPSAANLAALKAQGAKTTEVSAALRKALTSGGTTGNASPAEKAAIATLLSDAARLPALRNQIVAQAVTRSQAYDEYNGIVTDGYNLLDQVIRQETNAQVVAQSLGFVRMGRSEELLLRENALLVSDMAAHSFPAADRQQFTELAGARRATYNQTLGDLDPVYRAYYTREVTPQAAAALTALENQVISGGSAASPPPVRPQAWQQAVGGVAAGMSAAGEQASSLLTATAGHSAHDTYLTLILVGGLGLLAVLLSVFVSVLVGRGLARELAALRDSALELANKRLPVGDGAAARGRGCRRIRGGPAGPGEAPTRSARSGRHSRRCRRPRSKRPSARPGCGAGSTTSSGTWPGAASPCCTGSSRCSTPWSAGRRSRRNSRTCSASTT